jgi:hypothetical protein
MIENKAMCARQVQAYEGQIVPPYVSHNKVWSPTGNTFSYSTGFTNYVLNAAPTFAGTFLGGRADVFLSRGSNGYWFALQYDYIGHRVFD